MSDLLFSLLQLAVLDQIIIGLSATAVLGWLLGVVVALFFSLTRRCRMMGSPPWWAILAFGLAATALPLHQYLNGSMAADSVGKWVGVAVIGILCILYGLRRGRTVKYHLFGEYGCDDRSANPTASRIPVSRLVLHSLFWGIVLWVMSRMIPHASGRQILLLALLLFAGTYPFARRLSLLAWSLKSDAERDHNRGSRFLFGGGILILACLMPGQLLPDHLISPYRWVYCLAGLICLLIGLDYQGKGLSRLLGADASTPTNHGLPVSQPTSSPNGRRAGEIKTDTLAAIVATIRSVRTSPIQQQPHSDSVEIKNLPEETRFRRTDVQPVATPDGSRFRLLFLVLGLGLLVYAGYLWREYSAQEGDLGIVGPILVVFNSLVTLIGIIIFGRAFGRSAENDTNV